jgi:hypothetical protein
MKNFTKFLPLIIACFFCLGSQAQTCPGGLGTTVNIASLPYTGTALTTCGAGNEITASNAAICGSSSYYGGEDLVFIFTPTTTSSITISLTSSSSWIGMMLYNGCPFTGQGGTCVGNVQNSAGSKMLTVTVTSGVTYYLVVDTWPSPTCIPIFDLSITAPAGSDPCSSITTLSCGSAVSATPSGTGVWNVTACGFSTPGEEKIYSFTPTTTGSHSLQVNSVSGGYIDYFFKAASGGCNSSGWACIDDINFTGTYTIGTLTAGVQYYFLLDPEGTGSYNHNFQIVCPAPVVDPCSSITPLACATPATVTLSGTGVWNNSTCFFSTPGQEKVYSFTPTVTGVHNLQVTSATGTGYIDYQYKAASGGCSATGWTCIDDINFTGTFPMGTLTAGVQYYILLDAESTTSSTQTFQIVCPAATPLCIASPTSPTNGASICLPGPGTLSWPGATGATSYEVYFGSSPTPSLYTTTAATSVSVGSLSAGTYYWQIRPANSSGTASGCPVWSFTVQADPVGNVFGNPIIIGSLPYSTSGNNLAANCWTNAYSGPNNQSSPDVYYRFTITACQSRVNITTCGSGFDTYIHILNSSGDWIASDDNEGGCSPGLLSALQLDNLSPGTYYIVVEGFFTIAGTYNLSVTASDITPPTISNCPNNQNVLRNAVCEAVLPNYTGFPTTGDNCPGAITVTQMPTPGTIINSTVTVTLTAMDLAGNMATCSFTATPVDQTPPTITNCPNNQNVLGNASCEAVLPNYTGFPTTDDNCPGAITVTQMPTPGTIINSTVTVTLTATDLAGNTATCSFTATPVDQTPPSITCPTTQTLVLGANCTATLPDYTNLATTGDNCGVQNVTQSPAAGTSVSGTGNMTVTLTVTDVNDNETECTFTVTKVDNTAPSITCPATQTLTLGANCSASLPDYTNLATTGDNCGVQSVTQSPTVGTTVSGTGNMTVTLTVTDVNDNETECTFTVTKVDNTAPSITCPATQTLTLGANCSATLPDYTSLATTGDGCGVQSVTQSPAVGTTVSSAGNMTVALTVTDVNGLTNTCTFTVTKVDNTPPSITCPATQTLALGANCSATLPDYTSLATTGDGCGVQSVTQSPAVGTTVSSAGNMTVTLTVTDVNGLTNPCTFTVTKVDNTPPSITCPATQTLALGANCSATLPDYTSLATTGDGCGVQSVTQSPAVGTTVSGAGNMTVTLTVTDVNGLTNTCTFTVTKVDNTPLTVQCFNQTLNFNGEESIALDANDLANASDNCGVQGISLSPNTISAEQVGQIVPVTVTVTDINGNTVTCTAQITVSGLPAGWSQQPGGAGCAGNNNAYNPANGVWTATSTNCFYGPPYTSDATSFVQRTLCGNGSITAQVTSINGSALGWAGIVMRESNAPGAKKAQLMTNLSNFHRREFRTSTNGAAQPQQSASNGRYWLRITRAGNQFTMSVSANGTSWFLIGAQNIIMGNCIQMGLIATNYTANSTVTATFAGVSYTGSNATAASFDHALRGASIDTPHSFEVYPNPTVGELNVDLTQYFGRSVRLEVYSLEGKLLQFNEVDEVQTTLERLDLKGFQNGMYLVKVKSAGLPDATKRIVLQRG